LRRIDPELHARFQQQRELFNAALKSYTIDEVAEHGAAMVRANVAVFTAMEAAGAPVAAIIEMDARFKALAEVKRVFPGAEMSE
jgi:hypothetical protein